MSVSMFSSSASFLSRSLSFRGLHLGRVARTFALTEPPGALAKAAEQRGGGAKGEGVSTEHLRKAWAGTPAAAGATKRKGQSSLAALGAMKEREAARGSEFAC